VVYRSDHERSTVGVSVVVTDPIWPLWLLVGGAVAGVVAGVAQMTAARTCPWCKLPVSRSMKTCPHCRSRLH
jgi:hypothetical protein